MTATRFRILVGVRLAAALVTGTAVPVTAADNYPSRPVRLVVPFPVGGGNDFLARLAGQRLGEALGQPFVIDNRPGAGGTIATEAAARAVPDGYTLLLGFTGPLAISPLLVRVAYDPARDFTALGMLAASHHVLAIHPAVPARSVKELVALARAQPGKLNYASGGNGSPLHLVAELFRNSVGIAIAHIPYNGSGPAANAVLAGEAQLLFGNPINVLPQARAGRLVALAVTGPRRSAVAPELPSLGESGVPGVEVISWYAMLAPAGIAGGTAKVLKAELSQMVRSTDYREAISRLGLEPLDVVAEQFPAFLRAETARWERAVRSSGVRPH